MRLNNYILSILACCPFGVEIEFDLNVTREVIVVDSDTGNKIRFKVKNTKKLLEYYSKLVQKLKKQYE